jgi:hypothetical protein
VKRLVLASILTLAALGMVPAPTEALSYPIGGKWQFDVSTSIPLAKAVESTTPGATLDVRAMIGFGGGLTFYYAPDVDGEKVVSFNFPILALAAREGDPATLDLTIIGDVGVFDNRVRFGIGYECGKLTADRSRWIGVFSVGTNLFD